jgi:tRNA(fMet)-specific endonuclease VapC
MTLFVFDTDHLSLHLRGHEPIRKRLLTIPRDQIVITIISAEESLHGRFSQIRKAVKPEQRLEAYQWLSKTLEFLCGFTVFKFDTGAETQFQKLRAQKIKIGTQDLKIAAITLNQNATLITRNRRDFEQVPNLKIEDWSI